MRTPTDQKKMQERNGVAPIVLTDYGETLIMPEWIARNYAIENETAEIRSDPNFVGEHSVCGGILYHRPTSSNHYVIVCNADCGLRVVLHKSVRTYADLRALRIKEIRGYMEVGRSTEPREPRPEPRDTHRRIYLASSWRNEDQPAVVKALRAVGHEVYDFRNPTEGDIGFSWNEIDPEWQDWSPELFRAGLNHPVAQQGFNRDFEAMLWADTFVLLMLCGRSAHLEAGWAIGRGKPTAILLADGEPELMYLMADRICVTRDELEEWLGSL